MDCPDCPGDCPREKSIQLTKVIRGKLTKDQVCAECPKRNPVCDAGSAEPEAKFSLTEFLAGIQPAKPAQEPPPVAPSVPDCPDCGLSFAEFRQTGRLGCHKDYEVFKPALLPLIAKIQHATHHEGGVPRRVAARLEREARLAALQAELDEAIVTEHYERAAELRDAIQALRSEGA